jgi:O-antigen/teichoic acid export membrane protein
VSTPSLNDVSSITNSPTIDTPIADEVSAANNSGASIGKQNDSCVVGHAPTSSSASPRKRAGMLGILAIVDQCLYSGTNFVTAILIGRFAGATELGAYALAFSIVVLLMSLQRSLLVSPFIVIRSTFDETQNHAMRSSIAWSAAAIAIGSSAVCILVGLVLSLPITLALAAAIVTGLLRDFVRRMSMADYQLIGVLVIDAVVAILQLAGLVYLSQTATPGLSAVTALWCCAGVWGVVGGIGVMCSWASYNSGQPDLRNNVARLWPIGRWVSLTQVISTLQAFAIPWVMAFAHSIELAGVYAACWTMVGVISPAIEGICNLLEPALATAAGQHRPREFNGLLRFVTFIFGILMGGLVLLAYFGGEFALAWSYGESFVTYHGILVLLTLAAAIGNIAIPANKALIQLGYAYANSVTSAMTLVIAISLAVVGLQVIGVAGPALALVLGNAIGFLLRWWLLWRIPTDDRFARVDGLRGVS